MDFTQRFDRTPDPSIGQVVTVGYQQATVIGFEYDNDVKVRFHDGRETTVNVYELEA